MDQPLRLDTNMESGRVISLPVEPGAGGYTALAGLIRDPTRLTHGLPGFRIRQLLARTQAVALASL